MNDEVVRKKMQEVFGLVVADISSIRTGRANAGLVEDVEVPAYGGTQKMRIQELATITAPDPQTIVIDPWDKSIIGDIKKGLLTAGAGFNPSIDGEVLRITLPPMTSEDREKYVKLLSGKLESGKVMIRQIRGDAMREIKEVFDKKEVSEDEKFRQEKELQKLTDEYVTKIEEAGERKESEILNLS